jgi:hypothetical protein
VRIHSVELCHVSAGAVDSTHAVGIAGRFWEKQDGSTQDATPEEGDTGGDPPLRAVVVVLGCSVVDLTVLAA